MGSFVFRWPHPANEVYVTGTFDDWGKTEKLERVGDVFEKEVKLANATEDIPYKFVVDDNWTTDHMAPRENVGLYNENNILRAGDIKENKTHVTGEEAAAGVAGGAAATFATAPFLSSVGPDASTAKLAGELEVPLRQGSRQLPGGFPETPDEGQAFGVDPIPASAGIGNPISIPAGEKLPPKSEITPNTIDSTATTSKEGYEKDASADFPPPPKEEDQKFGIDPIPASAGIGNPISIPAGAKLPPKSEITPNTVESTATTSKEGYEKDASADFPPPPPPKEEDQKFGIDPIPASAGIGNPVSIPAGEKPPPQNEISSNTVDSTATTSKEGYEKDASAPFPPPPKEDGQTYSVDPIPASAGIGNPISIPAGEKLPPQNEISSNTIDSTATTSKEGYEKDASAPFPPPPKEEGQTFSVDPIPASSGIGNPISIPAGEKLPPQSEITSNTINSTATTSKEGYERDASAALSQPKTNGKNDSAFSVPPVSKNMIPESSLPIGGPAIDTLDSGPFIQSAAPQSSTAGLAGAVPLEPKRKAYVEGEGDPTVQSVGPESSTAGLAGAVPLEPKSKAHVEGEGDPTIQSVGPESTTAGLAGAVPLEPKSQAYVEGEGHPTVQSVGPESTTAGLAGAVPLEPKAKAYVEGEGDPTIQSVSPQSTTAGLAGAVPLEPRAKAYVEGEEDPTIQSVGVQSTTAGLAGAVPLEPKSKAYVEDDEQLSSPAANVPEMVKESMSKAHVGPEAAADSEEVSEKAAVESELLKKVHTTDVAGEPAPTMTAATSPTAPKSGWSAYDSVTQGATDETPSVETSKAAAAAMYEPEAPGPSLETSKQVAAAMYEPEAPGPSLETSKEAAAAMYEPPKTDLEPAKAEVSPISPETVGATEDTPVSALSTAIPETAPAKTADTAPDATGTKTEAPTPMPVPEQKTPAHPKDISPVSKDPKKLTAPMAKKSEASSATSSGTSSPANSSTAKEKKKKNRASGFFGKLKEKFKDL